MYFKNIFVTKIFATSLSYIFTYSSSPLPFTVHLHLAHCQPALRVQASVNYYLLCDDPVSFQSLVSWVKRQSRLVELKEALLPLGSTPADLHFQVCSLPTSQGVSESSECRFPFKASTGDSRNQDWDSYTSFHP